MFQFCSSKTICACVRVVGEAIRTDGHSRAMARASSEVRPCDALVAARTPPDWDGPWIDYVHAYVAPETPPEFLEVYARYAPTVDAAPAGVAIRRIAV